MKDNLHLVKQHFNVKIYRIYVKYLEHYYPDQNWIEVFESCGVAFSHLKNEDNWLSIEFDDLFMTAVINKINDDNFAYKVGCFAASRSGFGETLWAIGRYGLTLNQIYHTSYKFAAHLNQILEFKIEEAKAGLISVKIRPKVEQLTEREIKILERTFPHILSNTTAYYQSLTKIKNAKLAKVETSKVGESEYRLVIDYKLAHASTTVKSASVIAGIGTVAFFSLMFSNLSWFAVGATTFAAAAAWLIAKNSHLKKVIRETESHLDSLDENYKSLIETKGSLVRKLGEAEAVNLISEQLIGTQTETELLQEACDQLTHKLKFDRTIILLKDEAEKFLVFRAGCLVDNSFQAMLSQIRFEIELKSDDPTKVSNVFRNKRSILIEDVNKHISTLNQESQFVLKASGSRSFVCVPIASHKTSYGVILADAVSSDRKLDAEDVKVLETVGRHLALTMDNQKLSESYKKFVPFEMIDLIGSKDLTEVRLDQGKELEMCVIFCDIRGFTTMSEQMEPADAIAFLNSYFGNLAPIFVKHGGIIDKFLGDGMMVLFKDADSAVRASAEYHQQLITYNLNNRSGGARQMLAAGLGLHFGKVLLGPVGYAERMAISVVSDAVNLASRIDGLTKRFGIGSICTQELIDKCQTATDYRIIGELTVDGRAAKTRLYELYGHLTREEKEQRRESSGLLLELVASELHESGSYDRVLNTLVSRYPNDPVVSYYKNLRDSKVRATRKAA